MASESVSTSDTSTSSSNLPKNKKRAFYCVGKDKVNMSFRLGLENYSNMIPQISKEIYSNFSYQYKKRSVPHRYTRTSKVNDTAQHNNQQSHGVTTSSYSRCYVEDFMTRKVGESILLLVPTRYLDDPFTPWYELMSSDIPCSDFSFTKQSYRGYIGTITTNPKISQVSAGMHISDYSDGFGNHNYGSNVKFGECDHEMIAVLVTWKHVLEGKRDGIMVWREEESFRNVFVNFSDRGKTNQGMLGLLNTLFLEVYGDRIQCMHLIHCYYRKTILMQQQYMKQADLKINSYAPIDMVSDVYNNLLTKCDLIFKHAIELTYTDYVVIGSPIVTSQQIGLMVDLYTSSMPSHFNAFFEVLGFNQKSSLTKNLHLRQAGYYKKQVFYNMLAMSRQRNAHKMKHWAMISSGANYGRGIGEIVNRRS